MGLVAAVEGSVPKADTRRVSAEVAIVAEGLAAGAPKGRRVAFQASEGSAPNLVTPGTSAAEAAVVREAPVAGFPNKRLVESSGPAGSAPKSDAHGTGTAAVAVVAEAPNKRLVEVRTPGGDASGTEAPNGRQAELPAAGGDTLTPNPRSAGATEVTVVGEALAAEGPNKRLAEVVTPEVAVVVKARGAGAPKRPVVILAAEGGHARHRRHWRSECRGGIRHCGPEPVAGGAHRC
jgi:type III secretion system FlhB-like substrate exporter